MLLICDGKTSKKLLIFCSRYDDCYQFHRQFKAKIVEKIKKGAPPTYLSLEWLTCIPGVPRKKVKITIIVSNFVNLDGKLRVVIANIAFGMGIDCPNIMPVVHWGPSETVQEVGRAGRDGQPTCALLFHTPRDKGHVGKNMLEYSTIHVQCKRE